MISGQRSVTLPKQLFVVVRFDEPTGAADWKLAIKVLKVFTNGESAEREAERLRSINGPDKCVYEVHAAHSTLEN